MRFHRSTPHTESQTELNSASNWEVGARKIGSHSTVRLLKYNCSKIHQNKFSLAAWKYREYIFAFFFSIKRVYLFWKCNQFYLHGEFVQTGTRWRVSDVHSMLCAPITIEFESHVTFIYNSRTTSIRRGENGSRTAPSCRHQCVPNIVSDVQW